MISLLKILAAIVFFAVMVGLLMAFIANYFED